MPLNAYWIVQMEVIRYSAHPTTLSLFFSSVFGLLVLVIINQIIAWFWPKKVLHRGELLVIYLMLSLSAALAGHDFGQVLVPMLTWPYRYATPENRWAELILPHLPKGLMVTDPEVIRGYYEGNSTLYTWTHIKAWILPTLAWSFFIFLLLFIMLCLNSLLRYGWTERERLTYPLIQLPLELTSGLAGGLSRSVLPPFMKNKLFWIGFLIAGTVDVINSLNLYYPWIPTILTPGFGQSFLDLQRFVPGRPWNAIGWTPISWYPFVIGIGMLMPLDFLFSAWFFYLFWKMELVVSSALAWDVNPRFPYTNNQAFGAYMAFCVFSLWLGRDYLKEIFFKILGKKSSIEDRYEPLPYRWSALGVLVGMGLLMIFCRAMGMSLIVAFAFFIIYFALAVAITRMRAEMGTPVHDLHFTGPDWTLTELLGTRSFSAKDLSTMSLFFWFNRAYRCHPMPHQLEGFKMAERVQADYRRFFGMFLIAGAFGAFTAFWAMLHLNYHYGARAKSAMSFGAEAYNRLAGWMSNPTGPSFAAGVAILVGFGIAMFLEIMRARFPWWPFHPLGFAVTASWEINLVWMPLFIAWMLKSLILRYMGLKGFRDSLPFFFGLILGQFVVGSILNIIGILLEIPTYQFWQ